MVKPEDLEIVALNSVEDTIAHGKKSVECSKVVLLHVLKSKNWRVYIEEWMACETQVSGGRE